VRKSSRNRARSATTECIAERARLAAYARRRLTVTLRGSHRPRPRPSGRSGRAG
jgi:hypothetical protein